MGRTPLPGNPARPSGPGLARGFALIVAGTVVLAAASCQKDDLLKPGHSENNVLVAHYVPPDVFKGHEIKLDGEALEVEWGGQFDTDRPYTMIRLTAEDGAGLPGVPVYLAAKAVYTDDFLFLLMQWADPQADVMKDATYFTGEKPLTVDVHVAGWPDTTVTIYPADLTPRAVNLKRTVPQDSHMKTDTTITVYPAKKAILPPDTTLMQDVNWRRGTDEFGTPKDEDRLYLAFEVESAGDSKGSFGQRGCQIACHSGETPHFGRPERGRLDVWEWLSTRTNPGRTLLESSDNPTFPKYGTPGFLDDFTADPVGGLVADPGARLWHPNWSGDHSRPLYVYRASDDPFVNPSNPNVTNAFGEKAIPNNRLPYYYIWREKIEVNVRQFAASDTLNEAVLPQGQSPRNWSPGDAVSGYFYSYPSGSRADVKGKAIYAEGRWTLEIGRRLYTGDPSNDVAFNWVTGADSVQYIPDVYFTAAIGDNSMLDHRGSGPQVLHFAPKPSDKAMRKGGAQ